jgi:hypothetical protein
MFENKIIKCEIHLSLSFTTKTKEVVKD